MTRLRDLGLSIGLGTPGPRNAISDVAGVRVGHATIIRGDGPLVVGQGPVRTGVTVVAPHPRDIWTEPVFGGCHRLNGNGELTGLEWIRETGLLAGAIGLTNTHSVGTVRDALIAHAARAHGMHDVFWSLPVVGETYDGDLNDINGFHVRPEHVDAAIAAAQASGDGATIVEGGAGGGTGMVCHGFKGGIGTASRVTDPARGGWTVGALVQANHGRRAWLRVDGVPVGHAIPTSDVPSPREATRPGVDGDSATYDAEVGSIIGILATDAPLLPHQCERLAQRASLGLARAGGTGANSSGDIFLAFATGNRLDPSTLAVGDGPSELAVRMVAEDAMSPLFEAAIEATEEAIINALVAAATMIGRDGVTAYELPHDRLVATMTRYGRGPT